MRKNAFWQVLFVLVLTSGLFTFFGANADFIAPKLLAKMGDTFALAKPELRCEAGKPHVSLSWEKFPTATSYTVQRRFSTRITWQNVSPQLTATTTTFTDKKLETKLYTYTYRVVASKTGIRNFSNTGAIVVNPAACNTTGSSSSNSSRSSSVSSSSRSSSPSSVPGISLEKKWGAYVGSSTQDGTAFETTVGAKMDMQAIFLGDDDSFPSQFGSLRDQGKTLVIFWEPHNISLDAIIAGDADTTLKKFAADAKTYGGPVIFTPFHEMNGDWDSWGGMVGTNTPAKLISAWKHVHGLFAGATNVKFGWAVNNDSVPSTPANSIGAYYPGDAYVDYVGVDGFNFGDPWQSFDSVFSSAFKILKTYKKPIYIFSMASADGPKKAAWITDGLTVQLAKYPEVAGWIWFNQNKERDWRVSSDENSLKAFQEAVSRM